MTEIQTNKYSDRYFLDNWYTDEAKEKIAKMEVYRVAIDLCKESSISSPGTPLKIAYGEKEYNDDERRNLTRRIILSDPNGWPVMILRVNEDGAYEVGNWHRHMKKRGRDRNQLTSKSSKRIVNSVKPMIPGIILDARKDINTEMMSVGTFVASQALSILNTPRYQSTVDLRPELAYELLGYLFGDLTQADMGEYVRTNLREQYDKLIKARAAKKTAAERMQDLFAREKWMVGYVAHMKYGYQIGTAKFVATDNEPRSWTTGSIPLRRYRSLEHFYQNNPSVADELRAALTLFKVHREQVAGVNGLYLDSDKYFIQEDKFYDGIDVGTYYRSSGTVVNPQWLMMDRSV